MQETFCTMEKASCRYARDVLHCVANFPQSARDILHYGESFLQGARDVLHYGESFLQDTRDLFPVSHDYHGVSELIRHCCIFVFN
jgi:hypothetical protein